MQYLTDPESSGIQSIVLKTLKGYELKSGVTNDEFLTSTTYFAADKQLVGVFGLQASDNSNLNSLGFITFEVACDIVDPALPPGAAENTKSEKLDTRTVIYIILYVILGLILTALIVLVCMLQRQENRQKWESIQKKSSIQPDKDTPAEEEPDVQMSAPSPLQRIKTKVENAIEKIERRSNYKETGQSNVSKGDIEMQVAEHNLSNIFEKSNDNFIKQITQVEKSNELLFQKNRVSQKVPTHNRIELNTPTGPDKTP